MFSITFWLFLLVMFLLIIFTLHRLYKDEDFDKIHGPKGVFLLGNLPEIMKRQENLMSYFIELSQIYKRKYKFRLIFMKFVVIYSPEEAEALLSGNKNTKKGYLYKFLKPWLNEGLLLSYGKKWEHRRKILTPAFHFNALQYFSKTIASRCSKFVKNLESETTKSQTAVQIFIDNFTLNVICETAMGASLDENLNNFGAKYKNAIKELGSIFKKRVTRVWLYPDIIFHHSYIRFEQNEQLNLLSSFRNRVIQTRKDDHLRATTDTISISDGNDEFSKSRNKLTMLDILLKAANEGKVDEDGICEEVDTFIFEGHDTISSALQFTFMLLANHQHIQDKIVKEHEDIFGSSAGASTLSDLSKMKYLECCIKESLRLYPPVFFIIRRITEPVQLKDSVCPAGVEMAVSIYDLHRQADQFVDPLKFVPERFMTAPTWHRFAYLPFSAGPRNCIGQKLAMMKMKLLISSVLQKYRLLPITKPEDITIKDDIILRAKEPIYVRFEKRQK